MYSFIWWAFWMNRLAASTGSFIAYLFAHIAASASRS